MSSAREVIAKQVRWGEVDRVSVEVAHNVISALTAAGYRIIGPDELDDVTLEKAAEIADVASVRVNYGVLSMERNEPIIHREIIADAILSLKGGRS